MNTRSGLSWVHPSPRSPLLKPLLALTLLALFVLPVHACTIFLLTDTNHAFFCNNEDWSDPKTRIWFVPGSTKHYGGVYVGFDNNYAQGGLNTEGLAFDWVAGYSETWKPDPNVPVVLGNSGQQALESCATVEEAVAFFRGHQDGGFYRAKILIADRTGASVIIGGKDGKLQVEKSDRCRGFGYGHQTLDMMLDWDHQASVANGAKILRACLQKGQYATKYFNIFDLKTGDIFLFPFPDREDEVKFNLAAELKKGGHYYDMPQIHEQMAQPPRPLLANMERLLLDKYQPIPDKEPKVTAHVRAMLQDVLDGTQRADDFTPEVWKEEAPKQEQTREMVKSFGKFVSLTLVDRGEDGGKRSYRYRMQFEKYILLQQFVFDEHDKVTASRTEDIR